MTSKHLFQVVLLFILCLPLSAKVVLVKDGKATSNIIVDTENKTDLKAAQLMQDFIERISGARLPILPKESKPQKGSILIGEFQLPINKIEKELITEDGFILTANDNTIRIVGNEGNGAIYGVVTLLEDYLGVRCLAANAYKVNKTKDVIIPADINRLDNPSFRYRQTQSYSMREDSIFKLWHRLEEPKEVFADGLWVHTFNHLLPAAQFGESHPEYYAYMNGKRHPGTVSQWCLTNEDVFRIVTHRLDSIFKEHPNEHVISVSQNDSQIYCQCESCKAILDKEGTPAGPLIYFMNKLAEKFPDKEISTLAYLFSVPAPKYIKPLPNVNIMLCDIDAYREVTLTENPSGQAFVKEMEAWSKITDNIFIWDYGINFDNYVAPFPNFHILQPNMQLFKKNGATMHFSQIASVKGGDFSELRTYLVAKLLWNVDANIDLLMKEFLVDYYGDAAPYIYDYIKLREGAMLGSQIPLWIYDTPITHKEGMLNKQLIPRYYNLFDKADAAVVNNQMLRNRVREVKLAIQYSDLEITRTEPIADKAAMLKKVNQFRNDAAELGVTTLNERSNKIDEYCDIYIARNLSSDKQSLAAKAKIEYISYPDETYKKLGETALTDGIYGGATFNEGWIGWEGRDAEFIVDLGELKDIKSVEVDFLHKLGAWILVPKYMTVSSSVDKKHFQQIGHVDVSEDRDVEVKYVNIPVVTDTKVKARYIKIKIGTIGTCPSWHYGVGNRAWFFLDEVNVY